MADDIRNPGDTSKRNLRSVDWYEPQVQQGWTVQSGGPCPPMVNSAQVYGHNGTTPYTALYKDDPFDPDIWPPEVSIAVTGEQDENDAYVDSATVTITASDEHSDVESVEYKVGAGSWTAYTVPVVISTPGSYTVQGRATDTADNVSTAASVTFTVVAGG